MTSCLLPKASLREWLFLSFRFGESPNFTAKKEDLEKIKQRENGERVVTFSERHGSKISQDFLWSLIGGLLHLRKAAT